MPNSFFVNTSIKAMNEIIEPKIYFFSEIDPCINA